MNIMLRMSHDEPARGYIIDLDMAIEIGAHVQERSDINPDISRTPEQLAKSLTAILEKQLTMGPAKAHRKDPGHKADVTVR